MPTIKTRFALEGEKEYKNAISGIKSELGVLDAEAKNISATYAKQQGSAAELAAVSDNLSAKLAKQQEVLAKTRISILPPRVGRDLPIVRRPS